MTTEPQPNTQGLLRRPIGQLEEVMGGALSKAGIDPDEVKWTRMRWDVPDVTASWPKTAPEQSVHCWLQGRWPRYVVEVEGVLWHDDHKKGERRLKFFSYPGQHPAAAFQLTGLATEPEVVLAGQDQLFNGILELGETLNGTKLGDDATRHKLQPDPRWL